MDFLKNIKVGFKLGSLLLVAFLALGIVGGLGYYYLKATNKSLDIMYAERLVPVQLLIESRTNARAINGAVLELMLTTDVKKNQELKNILLNDIKKDYYYYMGLNNTTSDDGYMPSNENKKI